MVAEDRDEDAGSVAIRDRACAVLARAALFPISVDWSGKHHAIRPALHMLDLIRSDVVAAEGTPYSKLFPRKVIVVPSSSGGMQWNGQPEIMGTSVEVIPDKLKVSCKHCAKEKPGVIAFTESKRHIGNVYEEIVLCTDRLLKSDYDKVADPTLLEQRRDLPPRSLRVVEETLAHQLTKLREERTIPREPAMSDCERLALLEIHAARMAECLYRRDGGEVFKGSALRPLGFSLLPRSLQGNFRNRCVRSVATKATAFEYGKEAKGCVDTSFGRFATSV